MSAPSPNVGRFLPDAAARHPDLTALIVPGREEGGFAPATLRLTFAGLEAQVSAASRLLAAEGLRAGDRVLLLVRPGHELILVVFAALRLGLVPVVADPGLGLASFLRCVERTKPDALLASPLPCALSRLFPRAFASVRRRVSIGGDFPARLAAYAGSSAPVADPGPLAALLFTSGSTGPAKGVCYTHAVMAAQVAAVRSAYGIEPGGVDLPMLPVFSLFNPALGMATVVPPMNPSRPASADPDRLLKVFRNFKVTNTFGSPAVWRVITRRALETGATLPDLRLILTAGASVPPDLLRDLARIAPRATAHTPYGATECLPVASISGPEVLGETCRETEAGGGTCVGRVLPGNTVRVVAVSDLPFETLPDALADGSVGEFLVSGPVVTEAYDSLPEETRFAKVRGPDGALWHRIGDLGRKDGAGRLWFCGRRAERVETAAATLLPDCVEAVFLAHPKVARCALIGPGPRGAQRPALVVEPRPGDFPRGREESGRFEAELLALARSRPHTAAVTRFHFEKRLPVDPRHNAKIHRLALAKKYAGS